MATEASAPQRAKELSEAQIEQLQGVYSGALKGAVAECGVESVPDLLLDMAKRMEHEARRLKAGPPVDAKASHTQLMIALGKKEENVMKGGFDEGPSLPQKVLDMAYHMFYILYGDRGLRGPRYLQPLRCARAETVVGFGQD